MKTNQSPDHVWWSHVHWLAVLHEQGSYTAAAARLEVSKAAVSQRVAELERATGVALVQRTTRSVRLTEAGQQLVDGTRGAFDQIANSLSAVRDLAQSPQGRVRVTAPVALARQQLVPRLAGFLRAHPGVQVELDLSDGLRSLAAEGFDLAIRHTYAVPDSHVAWLLCRTQSLLVASPTYLRKRGVPSEPEELAGHDCLHYPRPRAQAAWTFAPAAGAARANSRTVPIRGPLATNNSEALRDAALGHLGVALVPDFSVQDALRAGRLVEVLTKWRPTGSFGEHLYALRPYAAHVPRAVQALVGYLRENLQEGFPVR